MLMTPTEFAKSQGFTAPYVYELIHKGHIIPVDGKIDEDQAVTALAALQTVGMTATRKGQPTHDHAFKQAKDTGPGTSPAAASPTSQVSPAAKATELSTVLLKTRIKNEVEKGKLLEVEAKLKTGQVLDTQVVDEEESDFFRSSRKTIKKSLDLFGFLMLYDGCVLCARVGLLYMRIFFGCSCLLLSAVLFSTTTLFSSNSGTSSFAEATSISSSLQGPLMATRIAAYGTAAYSLIRNFVKNDSPKCCFSCYKKCFKEGKKNLCCGLQRFFDSSLPTYIQLIADGVAIVCDMTAQPDVVPIWSYVGYGVGIFMGGAQFVFDVLKVSRRLCCPSTSICDREPLCSHDPTRFCDCCCRYDKCPYCCPVDDVHEYRASNIDYLEEQLNQEKNDLAYFEKEFNLV